MRQLHGGKKRVWRLIAQKSRKRYPHYVQYKFARGRREDAHSAVRYFLLGTRASASMLIAGDMYILLAAGDVQGLATETFAWLADQLTDAE